MARRANPERTLEAILSSPDRATALERLTRALGNTWEAGNRVGFDEGVRDANDDGPVRPTRNPYRAERS